MLWQWLTGAGVVVSIAAGIAYLLGWKGIIPSAQDLWRQLTKESVRYQYCTISCYKETFTFTGYFYPKSDDGKAWHYREPYSAVLTLLPPVQPSRRVKEHVEAVQKLVARLEADGWEYVGVPDEKVWYGYRFRRKV